MLAHSLQVSNRVATTALARYTVCLQLRRTTHLSNGEAPRLVWYGPGPSGTVEGGRRSVALPPRCVWHAEGAANGGGFGRAHQVSGLLSRVLRGKRVRRESGGRVRRTLEDVSPGEP